MVIQIFGHHIAQATVSYLNSELSPKLDLSIEGMRSQQFSEGVFAFLLLGIVVFSGIVAAFMFGKKRQQKLRTGERMMVAAIVVGICVAVVFGALQMLGGYLF